jgi:hypothetical protein
MLVALYQDTATAHEVVASLLEAGFSTEDVSLLVKDDSALNPSSGVSNSDFALLGALVGAAVGIGTALVPSIGPVIGQSALGFLLTAGIGAAAGALTGGIGAELIDIEDNNPSNYASALREGKAVVSLTTNDQWLEWAERIMRRYEPLKIEEREGSWYGSSVAKFDLEHASSRAMQAIRDHSSATMKQIKSSTVIRPHARSYEYRN